MICQTGETVLFVLAPHRTTEAQCWVPARISPPRNCMAPPMWEGMPENLRSCCRKMSLVWETLAMSEWVATAVTNSLLPKWWLSVSCVSFWCKLMESGTSWVLLEGFWSDCWSLFVLRKRPPEPLTLFRAWRWRDSWRYGCIHLKATTNVG